MGLAGPGSPTARTLAPDRAEIGRSIGDNSADSIDDSIQDDAVVCCATGTARLPDFA